MQVVWGNFAHPQNLGFILSSGTNYQYYEQCTKKINNRL